MTSPTAASLAELSAAGVSVWLDDLSRERLTTGGLAELTRTRSVVGVTTNPTIFAGALSHGDAYREQVGELVAAGASLDETVTALTTTDVAEACDVFAPIFTSTAGEDGRVSIEVDPRLAHDTAATVAQARALWERVDRPNLMIKIPATKEGLPAITQVIASGISVNVTLIFSLERYREVISAYQAGLEQAIAAGIDPSGIHSVASFFVSRLDVEINRRLEAIGTPEALGLRNRAGLANAQLAYGVFTDSLQEPRWTALESAGATLQRPLWASTGVKDPALEDTAYVSGLVAPHTVNTMPEKTLEAFADHGSVVPGTALAAADAAAEVLANLEALGISYAEVTEQLEREGVQKFEVSWAELLDTVTEAMKEQA
ncbi:MAG: transaldolase [Microbacteriaceae bacterium]|jgi:transaldolase|nr:transaldolase [Microbacteriaceae bacterium]MCI1207766.1 transaldolase [Microbacteriaceae bacterium]